MYDGELRMYVYNPKDSNGQLYNAKDIHALHSYLNAMIMRYDVSDRQG